MAVCEPAPLGPKTLADRLAEGNIPLPEALRYAALLADALDRTHAAGKVHGAVSPASVVLSGEGITLTPCENPADRALLVTDDVCGFGLVLYQMLTGRSPAIGDSGPVLEPTGIPAADRLIACCTARGSARLANMHKVLLELKLVAVGARRSNAQVHHAAGEAAVHAGLQQLEARLSERLAAYEKAVVERQQAAADALSLLHVGFSALETKLASAQQGVEAIGGRLPALEESIELVRRFHSALEVRLAGDIERLEKQVAEQASVIESMRASMAHTDSLVERVVEAMEAIQDSILDPPGAVS